MINKLKRFIFRYRLCTVGLVVFILTATIYITNVSGMNSTSDSDKAITLESEVTNNTVYSSPVVSSIPYTSSDKPEVIETVTVTYYDVPVSEEDQDFIKEVCQEYEFSEVLVYQIMYTESRYDPKAVSETNDHGIMQLNATWVDSYVEKTDKFNYVYADGFDIYDIRHNVLIAIRELDYWRGICNDRGYYSEAHMLECYNRGFNFFKNTDYRNYSTKVLSQEIDTYTVEKAVN